MRSKIGIPIESKEYIRLEFETGSKPTHLARFKIEDFPTPGNVKKHILNQEKKRCLERWHLEYKHFCSFSHALIDKSVSGYFQDNPNLLPAPIILDHQETELGQALTVSYTAAIYSVTELYPCVDYDLDLLESLSDIWTCLERFSLFSRMIWQIRAKSLLPKLIEP